MTFLYVYLFVGLAVTALKLAAVASASRTTDFGLDAEDDAERRRGQFRALGIGVFTAALGRGAIWPLTLVSDYFVARELSRHQTQLTFREPPPLLDVPVPVHQRDYEHVVGVLRGADDPPDGPIQPGSGCAAHLAIAAYFAHGVARLQGLKEGDGRDLFLRAAGRIYYATKSDVDDMAEAVDAVEAFARWLDG